MTLVLYQPSSNLSITSGTMRCTRSLLQTVQQQNKARDGSQALCIYVTSNDRNDIQDMVATIQGEFQPVEFLALVQEDNKQDGATIPRTHSGKALMETRDKEELPIANITVHTDLLDWFLIGEATHAVTSGTTFDGTARLRLPSRINNGHGGEILESRIHYNIERKLKKSGQLTCACRNRNTDLKWCL